MALKIHACMQDANHIDRIGDDAIEHDVRADGVFAITGANVAAILAAARIAGDDVEGGRDVAQISLRLGGTPLGSYMRGTLRGFFAPVMRRVFSSFSLSCRR